MLIDNDGVGKYGNPWLNEPDLMRARCGTVEGGEGGGKGGKWYCGWGGGYEEEGGLRRKEGGGRGGEGRGRVGCGGW